MMSGSILPPPNGSDPQLSEEEILRDKVTVLEELSAEISSLMKQAKKEMAAISKEVSRCWLRNACFPVKCNCQHYSGITIVCTVRREVVALQRITRV